MTNQQKFIEVFGKDIWQQMIMCMGLAEQFKEVWTSPYISESQDKYTPESGGTYIPKKQCTDDEKVADWLARLRSDLEVFGFPRNLDTYQRALDIAIKRFMESTYPNSHMRELATWKEVKNGEEANSM